MSDLIANVAQTKTHRNSMGESDEWYTLPEIFAALGVTFDLDPCSSGNDHVPVRERYTALGLMKPWRGFVWMNPPFGGRNGQVPWLRKFVEHGNGIGLVTARTSAGWFHDWMPRMEVIVFPRGKTKFLRPDGTVGKAPHNGIVLFAIGQKGRSALERCNLGLIARVQK